MKSYWSSILQSRTSRRRALAWGGTAAAGLGALSLVGCGGDDDEDAQQPAGTNGDGGGAQTSDLMPRPVDTTDSAVQGGNVGARISSDRSWYSYDINNNSSGNDGIAGWVYSRFVKAKLGTRDSLPDGSVDGDFAESFEVSPDGLEVTFKVRSGIKFDSRPPTNGREGTAADMQFGWERWVGSNPKRSTLAQEFNPESPVLSLKAVDDSTAVMSLAFPYAPLLPMMAYSSQPLVMPPESEQFDPRTDSRGTGPWIPDVHEEGVQIRLRRNPDWYEEGRPFVDTWTLNIIPEYAAGLAQFKAGQLDTFELNQEDILRTKQEVDSLVLGQRGYWLKSTGGWMFFGMRPGSPFLDERVRRAFSRSIDRDTFLDVFSNRKGFEGAGLPVETSYVTFYGPAYDHWLDPKEGELGEAGENFLFDPAEAKKLLSAAGHTSPIVLPWIVPNINHNEQTEAIRTGISGLGDFNLDEVKVETYRPDFTGNYRDTQGDFEGVAFTRQGDHMDPDHTIFNTFHPSSVTAYYVGAGEDTHLTELVNAQRRALDSNDRAEILKEYQRYQASKMWSVAIPGDFKPFYLYQPWLSNFDYHVPWIEGFADAIDAASRYTYMWIDESKR